MVHEAPPAPSPINGRRAPGPRPIVLRLSLGLPRQPASVGLARHVLGFALEAMAVDPKCRAGLLLALNEGCTNAVQHAEGTDVYEVRVSFDEDCCIVEILDSGRGIEQLPVSTSMPDMTAERGRGLAIIAMSTDSLRITARRPQGLAVRFTKRLT